MGPNQVQPAQGQSGPGSNSNEEVLHNLQSSKTGASPPHAV